MPSPTAADTRRPQPRPIARPTRLDRAGRRRFSPLAALRRHAAVLVIGVVVLAALVLVVALVASVRRAGDTAAASGPQVSGLTVPANYVPPTGDVRDTATVATAGPAQRGTARTPTRLALPARSSRPVAGGWTPTIGVQIANRALAWLNTPYSWDAGDASGPTLGRAVDHDSRNDANVRGFDCSGLVIYALAPWRTVDHSAAAQYVEAGTVHPTFAQLQPGDLVFWSSDGSVKGVGHVAVYIGNGDVVQAPQSGDVVRITPIDRVESGTIGTTRPLTA